MIQPAVTLRNEVETVRKNIIPWLKGLKWQVDIDSGVPFRDIRSVKLNISVQGRERTVTWLTEKSNKSESGAETLDVGNGRNPVA